MKFDNSLQLAHHIAKVSNAEIASHNQYYLSECPYCGNDNHSHISSRFGETNVGTFFKCFACGKATSIYMLGVKLGIINPDEDEEPEETVIKPLVKQSSLPDWWNKRWQLLEQYQNNREKIYMWAQYKNVRPDEIEKYALGYGYLPHTTTPRLIVPVFDGKELIGFRGRLVDNPEGNQVKWLSTKGLSPSNMKNPPFYSRAKDYSHLFVVENMVDAILVNERTPHTAIPTMSVTYWNESWTEKIREHKMDINHACMFGIGRIDESNGSQNDESASGRSLRYTWGVLPYVQLFGQTQLFTYSSSSYDDFVDWMRVFFAPEDGNSGTKICLASRKILGWFNKLGNGGSFLGNTMLADTIKLDVTNIPNSFGFTMLEVKTIFGRILMIAEPLLRGLWEDYAILLDPKNISYKYLNGNGRSRDTFIKTNVQDNDMDGRKDLIITEAGMEILLPETHCVIKFS
jgi:hypothetical protein